LLDCEKELIFSYADFTSNFEGASALWLDKCTRNSATQAPTITVQETNLVPAISK
jgi:hypothetical protein